MEDRRNHSRVIPIGITVCILGIAAFLLLHFFGNGGDLSGSEQSGNGLPSEISFGTDNPAGSGSSADMQTPSPSPLATPASSPPLEVPDINEYRTHINNSTHENITKDENDIYKGYLLLINREHAYDIPDDLDLVSVNSMKSSSYKANSADQRLLGSIMEPLNTMIDAFEEETGNSYMYIISTFRDIASQRRIQNSYIAQLGERDGRLRAADPGHSEHHTGLAFDFAILIGGVQYPMTSREQTQWFYTNSYKYGFALRYPRGKTNITNTQYEPWHYRYVGLPHSFIMHTRSWVLEEYIENIKNYTSEKPLETRYNGIDYEVYYTDNMDISIPVQAEYTISGNNTDGFIVTIFNRYDKLTNVSVE